MNTWPSTLPQAFLSGAAGQGKLSQLPQSNIIQTQNDQGQPKYRQAFTAINTEWQGDMIMTMAQVEIFMDFYQSQGAKPWSWVHPWTQETAIFQFSATAPQMQHLDIDVIDCKLVVMMLAQSGP